MGQAGKQLVALLCRDEPADMAQLVLYRGARVVLTRNLNKPEHFVNGMVATVEDFDARAGCIVVRTVTNRRLSIHRYTDDAVPHGRCVYYPVRLRYAGTVYKYQGRHFLI